MYCLLKNGEIRVVYGYNVELGDKSYTKISCKNGLVVDIKTNELNLKQPYSLVEPYEIRYENENIEKLFNRYIVATKSHYFIYCRREYKKKYPSLDTLPSDAQVYGASWGGGYQDIPIPILITNSKLNKETGEWELLWKN